MTLYDDKGASMAVFYIDFWVHMMNQSGLWRWLSGVMGREARYEGQSFFPMHLKQAGDAE